MPSVPPDFAHCLPRPGPLWGGYPLRASGETGPPRGPWDWRSDRCRFRRIARQAADQAERSSNTDAASRAAHRDALRQALRRDGLVPDAIGRALGLASALAAQTLSWVPRESQLVAAAALLEGRMAEMATGEGKTLAVGLAAAVAALAGIPVHVVTANEYLAARDAARLAPLFDALGLRAAPLVAADADAQRRAVYGHDIVYATAKDLGFDFLRDRIAAGGEHELERIAGEIGRGAGEAGRAAGEPRRAEPLMRGLCMAVIDEADSVLLDEAEVPLVLSRAAPQAARRAFLWQALALARQFVEDQDYLLDRADRQATLTAAGEQRLDALASGLGGPWLRPRYRREALALALCALHGYRRNEHYVVRGEAIELIDEVTGRVAAGRVWSRGLQTLVALKERLDAPAETETVAQITFQRLFQRYWRLGGISGTLWEARRELRDVYGARVVRIALHAPSRRRDLPMRRFQAAGTLLEAIAPRVAALRDAGRPVLIGSNSVAESMLISQQLTRHGIEHRVLNALQDADEAEVVAQAGQAGRVTVATRLAGRGTDIELDAPARAAGGLHVLSCQDNPSRRLDRQLEGRAGRHGDPGSTEAWLLPRIFWLGAEPSADNLLACTPPSNPPACGSALARAAQRWIQSREERRRAELRRGLLQQDLHWERRLAFAGASG